MKVLSKIYIKLIFLFLYMPILIMIVFSFNKTKSRSTWTGFSLNWYIKLFKNNEILASLLNTILVATVASIFATIIGTMACVGIYKMKKFYQRLFLNVNKLTIINPEIVTGVSLILLYVYIYNTFGFLKPGMMTLILTHTTFCIPYVILSVFPRFQQMNPNLYEAAQDLGCTPVCAFFKVIIPDILPGIITGITMAFTLSIDDFTISYFTCGSVQTLPITIYSMTRKIVSPEINALSTILFLTVFFILLIINLYQNNNKSQEFR